jgi:anti-sigma regulatory factor (Ser/Thr protein kinase)
MTQIANRLHFKTNVQLKSIIGKDLINNDNIAVLELVKNSYDAGSPRAIVEFKNLKENDDTENMDDYSERSSKLLIKDFGVGMDDTDIEEKWLNIAYSEKKSENGRFLAGVKGVGRFSCDRLGRFLDMYTRKKDNPIYLISIDWEKFEVEDEKDLKIQDIDISRREIDEQEFKKKFNVNSFDQGTFIEISKLRSQWATLGKKGKWDTSKILDLRRYLEKLINPNQAFHGKGFAIEMLIDEFSGDDALKKPAKKINGPIENKIFKKLNFTTTVIEAEISPAGDTITTALIDKNRNVFKVVEKNVDYRLLKDIKIVIFYLNPYAKAYFKRYMGIRSLDFGSIFLFINGFRVNPLGDYGDDWLRMEVRKGQGYAKFLGTREVVGRIEINDYDRNFKIISSREGIVKDRRFSQIVDTQPSFFGGLFYKTLKRLEKYVVEGLEWDRTEITGKTIEKMVDSSNWKYEPGNEKYHMDQSVKDENVLESLSSIVLVDTKKDDIISLRINKELITQLLLEQKDKAREKFDKFFSRNALFAKEILDDLTWDTINNVREELEEKIKEIEEKEKTLANKQREIRDLTDKKKELEEEVEKEKKKFNELKNKSADQEKQIYFLQRHVGASEEYDKLVKLFHHVGITSGDISKNLRNLKRKISKETVSNDHLLKQIEKMAKASRKIKTISNMATYANINFSTDSLELTQENLTGFIIQYIENVGQTNLKDKLHVLLDKRKNYAPFIHDFNSIEIVMLFDNMFDNSRKAKAGIVTIEIISHSSELAIKVRDNGCGIPAEHIDKIFDFGFTTTDGTGLGLFHVKDIVENLGGEIMVNPQYKNGSEFIIKVSK